MKFKTLSFIVALVLVAAGCTSAPAPRPIPVRAQAVFTIDHLEPSQVDVVAQATFRTVPVYPRAFRATGVHGHALVEFIVEVDGTAREVQCVEASDAAFGRATVAAISQWHFKPALKHGVPVATRMAQRMEFQTQGD